MRGHLAPVPPKVGSDRERDQRKQENGCLDEEGRPECQTHPDGAAPGERRGSETRQGGPYEQSSAEIRQRIEIGDTIVEDAEWENAVQECCDRSGDRTGAKKPHSV